MTIRKTLLAALACALLTGALATPAPAAFHIVELDAGVYDASGGTIDQAAGHPFVAATHFTLSSKGFFAPEGNLKDVKGELPPGFIANPTATPTLCSPEQLTVEENIHDCPASSQVGVARIYFPNGIDKSAPPAPPPYFPVFNMVPPAGSAAMVSFVAVGVVTNIVAHLRSDDDYGINAEVRDISQVAPIVGSDVELWGVPADPGHDTQRYCRGKSLLEGDAYGCSTDAEPTPFVTNPTECTDGPLPIVFSFDSWQNPGSFISQTLTANKNGDPLTFAGCPEVPFTPSIDLTPSADSVETPSGLELNVDIPDDGLLDPEALAQSHVKKTVVALPEGVTLNPSAAEGLSVCTPAEYAREQADSAPGAGCPNGSKIGSVDVESPLLKEHATGSVFLAQQDDPTTSKPGAENPFDSLIALYIVAKIPERGVIAKLAGKVEPDPRTGRLVGTFDDLPRVPFKHFSFKFREGARAPLVTPPSCATYTTEAQFTPWSATDPDNPAPGEIRSLSPQFKVTRGLGGGSCPPGGVPPFKPGFEAGSTNNNAGSHTPFTMRLTRQDGEQDMTRFSAVLPPGVLGKLAGVDKCSQAAIVAAKGKTGREELANPSCPANSQIGRSLVGAGVGPVLTYVPGKVYLGGPFHGDPLSVIAITPAVAGPFDVGTVVVQEALTLNPKTAEVEVDGAASDPIPHILKGIPAKLRDLRVYVDRPNFILNPTSCNPSRVNSTLFGGYLDVFSPADDVPVALSDRFQAASCASLGFKPKLSLNLKGGTRRGGHPGLRALYKPRPGDTNVKNLVVRLPRSAFLDQAHIRTICTRVQFAADSCPPAAQYGYIKAWTPLLEEPLEGPVWLRSSNHKLPDLVFDLHGLVDVEVATRIDSAKGGIRASIESAPDAPLSKVELRMQGGKKGLIINSRNLCGSRNRAEAQFTGQNGKRHSSRPVMKPSCKK